MSATKVESSDALAGPVERPVRPAVWMVRRHDAPNYWIPFLHEPVDALNDPEREVVRLHWPEDIAAERERCARICDTTPPHPFRPSIEAAHAIRNQKA